MVRLTSADYYFTGILLYRNAHGFMVPDPTAFSHML